MLFDWGGLERVHKHKYAYNISQLLIKLVHEYEFIHIMRYYGYLFIIIHDNMFICVSVRIRINLYESHTADEK